MAFVNNQKCTEEIYKLFHLISFNPNVSFYRNQMQHTTKEIDMSLLAELAIVGYEECGKLRKKNAGY